MLLIPLAFAETPVAERARAACVGILHVGCDRAEREGWVQEGVADLRVRTGEEPFFTESGAVLGDTAFDTAIAFDTGQAIEPLRADPEGSWGFKQVLSAGYLAGARVELVDVLGLALWWPAERTLRWLGDACRAGALSADGRVLAVALHDADADCTRLVRLDVATLEPLGPAVDAGGTIQLVSTDATGAHVATALFGGPVVVWSASLERVGSIPLPPASLPRAPRPWVGGWDVWHEKGAIDLAWSPDGEVLAVAWMDAAAQRWTHQDGVVDLDGRATQVVWSGDGGTVATATADHLSVYDRSGRRALRPITLGDPHDKVGEVAVSADGARIAVGREASVWLVTRTGAQPLPEATLADRRQVTGVSVAPPESRRPPLVVRGHVTKADGAPAASLEVVFLARGERFPRSDAPPPTPSSSAPGTRADDLGRFASPPLDDQLWQILVQDGEGWNSCAVLRPYVSGFMEVKCWVGE